MKKFNSYIIEKVRKDPDEEKARLQSRLDRAKTLGQQTRVADALSAARAAAGEKKPSDKRSWGASTGTAERLKKTTVRRTPSGISKLLAKRLAPLKRVDTSWIDEGSVVQSVDKANRKDLKELPGKAGEVAHDRLHALIKKLIKTSKKK